MSFIVNLENLRKKLPEQKTWRFNKRLIWVTVDVQFRLMSQKKLDIASTPNINKDIKILSRESESIVLKINFMQYLMFLLIFESTVWGHGKKRNSLFAWHRANLPRMVIFSIGQNFNLVDFNERRNFDHLDARLSSYSDNTENDPLKN